MLVNYRAFSLSVMAWALFAVSVPALAIEEVPPEERPEGVNVAWIPGYWASSYHASLRARFPSGLSPDNLTYPHHFSKFLGILARVNAS